MARIADASLHHRILDATYRLLRRKGLEAVTLRAVAKAAGTSTPTVYGRFATKEALVLAVADMIRNRVVAAIVSSSSPMAACKSYLDFAIENPRDYRLMFEVGWPRIFENLADQPGQIWAMQKLAELHGGHFEDYRGTAEALFVHLHGAATFLAASPNNAWVKRFHASALNDCKVIISNAKLFKRTSVIS